VAGNVNAGDQAILSQRHDLIERRMTDHKMLTQDARLRNVREHDMPLANLKCGFGAAYRQ